MLIKLFGVPKAAQTKELINILLEKVSFEYAGRISCRVGFSPILIRRNNEPGAIRILVTGPDAHGIERDVIGHVGQMCELNFLGHQELWPGFTMWPGFEDPALPGQPGLSRGRPQ